MKLLSLISGVIIGLILGSIIGHYTANSTKNKFYPIRQTGNYAFINPLLACEFSEKKEAEEYAPLKIAIQNIINQKINKGAATDISFYFRNPISGEWTGINETTEYHPASILKIPILMAYLKSAEEDKTLLLKKIKLQRHATKSQTITPTARLELGTEYTIAQLLSQMIIYSDNDALGTLASALNANFLSETLSDIGINPLDFEKGTLTLSAKSISLLFRVLYNASYLNRELSEKALTLLNGSNFKEGIRAGVPEDIPIAHKFGEYDKELHECGIIYGKKTTYILCIMTKGDTIEQLKTILKDISAATYKQIEK